MDPKRRALGRAAPPNGEAPPRPPTPLEHSFWHGFLMGLAPQKAILLLGGVFSDRLPFFLLKKDLFHAKGWATMQALNEILQAVDPLQWIPGGRKRGPIEGGSGAPNALSPAAPSWGSQRSWELLRDILGRYDLRQITPRQFARLLEELRQAQLLSEADWQQLTQILADLTQEGIEPDEPVDLLRFYTKKLQQLQDSLQEDDHPAFAQMGSVLMAVQKRWEWVTRLALLRGSPELAGIDLLG